jgi:hypothetical protein
MLACFGLKRSKQHSKGGSSKMGWGRKKGAASSPTECPSKQQQPPLQPSEEECSSEALAAAKLGALDSSSSSSFSPLTHSPSGLLDDVDDLQWLGRG